MNKTEQLLIRFLLSDGSDCGLISPGFDLGSHGSFDPELKMLGTLGQTGDNRTVQRAMKMLKKEDVYALNLAWDGRRILFNGHLRLKGSMASSGRSYAMIASGLFGFSPERVERALKDPIRKREYIDTLLKCKELYEFALTILTRAIAAVEFQSKVPQPRHRKIFELDALEPISPDHDFSVRLPRRRKKTK